MREAIARFGAAGAAYAILESPLSVLQHLDTATVSSLARVTLVAFPGDTAAYYFFKAALHRTRGERTLERRYADSVVRFIEARRRSANESRAATYLLALSYAQLGRAADAVTLAEQSLARSRERRLVGDATLDRLVLAEVHAVLGQDDLAIDHLEYLLSVPSNVSVQWLRIGATWDSLRNSPRFQRLLDRGSTR